jgi:hypothetical protein
MFRRQPGKSDEKDASLYSRRSAAADLAWSLQDRLRRGGERALDGARRELGKGLDRASFPVEKKVVWPLQDRAHRLGAPARALSFGLVILLAATAGVAGLIWAAPDRPAGSRESTVAAAPAKAIEVKAEEEKHAPEPTLHGAAPVFEPARPAAASKVDPAKEVVKPLPATAAEPSGAPADDSSSASASSAGSEAKAAAVDGPPAGPAAIAVAREFSAAFVIYETGGLDAGVRKAFGATATPELSRALLRRPPRLPANVEVPRAKVLNVVAGPSHDGVYSVSVSLLRVGVTSELRLDMEELKGKEWRVTNVLG